MAYAEAVTATPPAVTDEMVADLRRELDDAAAGRADHDGRRGERPVAVQQRAGPDQPGLQGPLRDPRRRRDRPPRAFDRHRRLLFRVAYQMLGSVADAEDVVQDTWLRWSAADRSEVVDERAYLVQITTRLALDRMDSARARRESYVGPWLPEPLLTGAAPVARGPPAAEPEDAAELGSRCRWPCSWCSRRCPRRSGPSSCCGRSSGCRSRRSPRRWTAREAAVRQMAHRAKEHVQARQPRFDTDRRRSAR